MRSKLVFAILAVVLIGIQFYRPDINPTVGASTGSDLFTAYPDAPSLIRDACYDCHSNESELPWYSHVNPPGIFVRNHIIEGREHLNFSMIGQMSPDAVQEIFRECSEEISRVNMPMKAYTWLHPHARLSAAERAELAAWFSE